MDTRLGELGFGARSMAGAAGSHPATREHREAAAKAFRVARANIIADGSAKKSQSEARRARGAASCVPVRVRVRREDGHGSLTGLSFRGTDQPRILLPCCSAAAVLVRSSTARGVQCRLSLRWAYYASGTLCASW